MGKIGLVPPALVVALLLFLIPLASLWVPVLCPLTVIGVGITGLVCSYTSKP